MDNKIMLCQIFPAIKEFKTSLSLLKKDKNKPCLILAATGKRRTTKPKNVAIIILDKGPAIATFKSPYFYP